MNPFIQIYLATVVALLLAAGVLHLIPKLGNPGRKFSNWFVMRRPWIL